MPIQSPFSRPTYYFDMLNTAKGKTTAVATGIIDSTIATGTSNTNIQLVLPWQFIAGNTYWSVIWGHGLVSSATGGMKVHLVDQTNGVVLYTFSSNTTSPVTVSAALATSIVFIKPTGVAKIGLQYQNADTNAREFEMYQSAIVVF